MSDERPVAQTLPTETAAVEPAASVLQSAPGVAEEPAESRFEVAPAAEANVVEEPAESGFDAAPAAKALDVEEPIRAEAVPAATATPVEAPATSGEAIPAAIETRDLPEPVDVETHADRAQEAGVQSREVDQVRARHEIRPPDRSEALFAILPPDDSCCLRFVLLTGAVMAAIGSGWIGGSELYRVLDHQERALAGKAAVSTIVERIIGVESNGDPNAKNKRSSATGAAQFLDETWLEMIRAYRPDLAARRTEKQILELRRDAGLAREMTTRLVERNAAILSRRGLPLTPGTLYLTHFAGAAGAVAILSVAEDADAASLMAKADASGRMTREKIVTANPFLAGFTVADLKSWADRKMRDRPGRAGCSEDRSGFPRLNALLHFALSRPRCGDP